MDYTSDKIWIGIAKDEAHRAARWRNDTAVKFICKAGLIAFFFGLFLSGALIMFGCALAH